MIDSTKIINALIDDHPELIAVLMKYGVNCVSCPFSKWDDLGTGLKKNGIESPNQIENIIAEMNETISEKNIN
ncbi:MAG: DUF1858 domain-containing protein [bacterium]|nr:DUF1858 domain-containing protein [bacterium]